MSRFVREAPRNAKAALLVTLAVALTRSASAEAQSTTEVFRDDFSATTLETGWSFVREQTADWSLVSRPGFFQVTTRRGTFGAESAVNTLLVRPWEGDARIEARLEFDPRDAQQFAGLIFYQDDGHAVALGLTYAAGERGVFRGVALLAVGDDIDPAAQPPVAFYDESNAANPAVIHLRLLRVGDQFVGAYSPDGEIYSDIGTVTNVLEDDLLVGLGGANGDYAECGSACDATRIAAFDYFSVTNFGNEPPDDPAGVVLEDLQITGPAEVSGNTTAGYVLTAYYSDGTSEAVTDIAEWSVYPADAGSIAEGELSPAAVDADRNLTVVAAYSHVSGSGETRLVSGRVVRVLAADDPAPGRGLCGSGVLAAMSLALAGWSLIARRVGPCRISARTARNETGRK